MLICPICKSRIVKVESSYKCENNHSFDISKKGYTNLLINHPNAGDNKEMVLARYNFLEKGYYQELKDEIKRIINKYDIKTIADLGCGTGYYSSNLDIEVYGFDISKEAINKASGNKSNHYYVASSQNVPLSSETLDATLVVFAPLFIDEIYRILKPNGYLILVTPSIYHLYELKTKLYDNPYLNEEKKQSMDCLKEVEAKNLKYQKLINKDDLLNLIKMTPYFYKTDSLSFDKIKKDELITLDFNIQVYKK